MSKKPSRLEWAFINMRLHHIMRANKHRGRDLVFLFLDFDGVINVFREPGTPEYEEAIRKKTFEFWDDECVRKLNAFARDFHVEVIISSSWRYAGLPYCIDYLRKAGMEDHVRIIDTTEIAYNKSRQTEIVEYLFGHPYFSEFLVFDDGDMPEFKDRMILTHPMKGWTDEIDAQARKICGLHLK